MYEFAVEFTQYISELWLLPNCVYAFQLQQWKGRQKAEQRLHCHGQRTEDFQFQWETWCMSSKTFAKPWTNQRKKLHLLSYDVEQAHTESRRQSGLSLYFSTFSSTGITRIPRNGARRHRMPKPFSFLQFILLASFRIIEVINFPYFPFVLRLLAFSFPRCSLFLWSETCL